MLFTVPNILEKNESFHYHRLESVCSCGKSFGIYSEATSSKKNRIGLYALVGGKPRTPIPGECGALAGDFSGFGLSLFPRYAGFSTALGASIGERGP